MLVESSRDILYLVIAFCVLWVTVFLCWIFYYLMRILKNANEIVEEFRMRLQGLTEAIQYIRGKVEHISAVLTAAGSGVGGLVKKVVTRKAEQWMAGKTAAANDAAKTAVERAVNATAKTMRRAAKRLRPSA
ncbi:MAG: hypothetical protein HYV42_03600 [Candidatus Magasanikbacteria bacterium]|nr:hypothetical protein [Candidatus Magasanikbacteria bacterium]